MTTGVEESYSGPRWDEGELTAEFMDSLLEWLKDEKRLHRKYAYKVRWYGAVQWTFSLPLSSIDIAPIQADL